MAQPVSISAWIARGHNNLDVIVHHDDYFVEDRHPTPLDVVLTEAVDRLPDEDRAVINTVVMAGMSYRAAAEELDMYLTSGHPNKKRVYRIAKRALATLRADLDHRAPWLAALMGDPTWLDDRQPTQGELL